MEQSTEGDAGANADLFPINTGIFSLLKSANLKGEACLPRILYLHIPSV